MYNNKVTYTRLEQLRIKGAHKNNSHNNTPIFIRLNKTTQKHGRRKKVAQDKTKSDVLKQMYFNE
jgi:hypothetical protein